MRVGRLMLAPRAQEHEIFCEALHNVGLVRAHIGAINRRLGTPQTVQELAGTLNGIAMACQAKPVDNDISLSGRIGRMLDPQWWTRNVRRELLRENEALEHAQGRIKKKGNCYVSNHAMQRKAERSKINRRTLAELEVVNEEGIALNLLEVSDKSVSNPKIRRAELMVRCRGFEEMASYMEHEAVFLTVTAPSRFHRFAADGKPNPKWTGATPKDAQKHLCLLWARIRAEWKRQGISPYGFRVAEPHHDGCPHWHILLFAPLHQIGWFEPRRLIADRNDSGCGLLGIAGAYALEDSPGEAGAMKHRFTAKRIDTTKGSATGYIAKYICKNIDGVTESGEEIGLDFASGTKASEASQRVRTWASTWGIRQFQQIGGPSVTVWRELRRLAKDAQEPILQIELFEGPRAAADRSLWALFWMLQGGPEVSRAKLSLRPMYVQATVGKYGDEAQQIRGVLGFDIEQPELELPVITRLHTWTIQRAGLAEVNASEAVWRNYRALRTGENSTFYRAYDAIEKAREFERSGEAASTWTSVNNCTVLRAQTRSEHDCEQS